MNTSLPPHPPDAPVALAAAAAHLTTAECWDLLEHADLGRLALVDAEGVPALYPINFVAHEGAVYLRSARDAKLTHITRHSAAALEVDGEDEEARWSVVLRGTAGQVRDEAEIAASSVRVIPSASPARKPVVIKVTPRTVTGRRFAKTDAELRGPAGQANVPVSAHTPPTHPESAHPDAGTTGRQTRPVPIPHFPPPEHGAC